MKYKTSALLLSLIILMTFVLSACGEVSNVNTADSASDTSQSGEVSNANTADSASDTSQIEAESSTSSETEAISQNDNEARQLKMTLDGNEVVMAAFVEGAATEEFITQLPFTVTMTEHMNRQKEIYLPFSLTEENLQNTVYEYEIGDIVYWHPGPTMGIFHDHDGRGISAGIEILAKLDVEGVAAFASYPDDVEVLFELEANDVQSSAQSERLLTITLDDEAVIYAELLDTPAANTFTEQLPLTLDMTDYLQREKHAPLNFSIDDSDLLNIQTPYEIGDIIYYPPGPTFAMYYDHDGREISAGMEVIARLNAEGIETLATYPNAVKVTVELSE